MMPAIIGLLAGIFTWLGLIYLMLWDIRKSLRWED